MNGRHTRQAPVSAPFSSRAPLVALALGLASSGVVGRVRADVPGPAGAGSKNDAVGMPAAATPGSVAGDGGDGAYLAPGSALESQHFWWPSIVVERASTHLTGVRSIDETRFGVALAYRTAHVSPHVRALLSPPLGVYQNFAGLAGAGLRVHFELAGVPLSYGVGLSIEARLRDSLWLAYATPFELGTPLYRGDSAEHYLFIGARHSMAGSLINSYLLDPNGYNNEESLDELAELREERPWQLYVSVVFGRRVE